MAAEQHQARYRTAAQIRHAGAVGNLGDGIELDVGGIATRLIAWPGNGFQTEAVHVLTVRPGQESDARTYDASEVALLCLAGEGEVVLHGAWRTIRPGDVAYVPEGVAHAVRCPGGASEDLLLVAQITPPQLDLYEPAGLYDRARGTWNDASIFKATVNAPRRELPPSEMAYHDHEPEVRVQHLPRARVRREGALFNVYAGGVFEALGLPGRYVLWPPAGTRQAGFNYVLAPAGESDVLHVHPVSDECLVVWEGRCQGVLAPGWSGGEWIDLDTYDVLLAPCGVLHGHRSGEAPSVMGGFASPPQPDLLLTSGHLRDGRFDQGEVVRLDPGEVAGVAALRRP